jgi:hypothetical protein
MMGSPRAGDFEGFIVRETLDSTESCRFDADAQETMPKDIDTQRITNVEVETPIRADGTRDSLPDMS